VINLNIKENIKIFSEDKKKELIRDRCPICGYQFDEDEIKHEDNICHYGHISSIRELITEDDDFAWVI
jgi:hypothetical protein